MGVQCIVYTTTYIIYKFVNRICEYRSRGKRQFYSNLTCSRVVRKLTVTAIANIDRACNLLKTQTEKQSKYGRGHKSGDFLQPRVPQLTLLAQLLPNVGLRCAVILK